MLNNDPSDDLERFLDLRAIECEMGTRLYGDFMRLAWRTVEPAKPFLPNWHIDAIAAHMQAVSDGKIRKLLITMPPGHAKSLSVTVLWGAWQWIRSPEWRALFCSYDQELATRDSMRRRALLNSPWFQKTFQPEWKFSGDQNQKNWFENDKKGFQMALGVGGKGTGFRSDCLVIDDPLNARKQHSEPALRDTIFWFDQVMSSRLNDLARGSIIIVMQRLNERDLAGHVLERGGFDHLNLPTEYEPERACVTSLGRPDPRTKEGELLFEPLFPAEVVAEAKRNLGTQGFAAQHQQRPAPAEGDIFKRHWWRFWQPAGANLPPVMFRDSNHVEHQAVVIDLPPFVDELAQSWDCAFKSNSNSDFVVGHVWGRIGPKDILLLDRVHGRMNFPETVQAIVQMSRKWPAAIAKLIEDKANGSAVIQTLAHLLPGIIPVNPLDGKVVRAHAVTARIEAGDIYLPHPSFAPWVWDVIEQFAAFPNGRHDDDVDAMTQALARLTARPCVIQQEDEEEDYADGDGPIFIPI